MALQVAVDRGYLNLLAQLRQSGPSISAETLQAAICHYLVRLPSTQPTPTPLTASVVASPAWHPLSLAGCLAIGNTFRVAIRQNYTELKKKKRGLFDPSLTRDLTTWTRGILNGLNDGDALLRLSISGGLFLGMKDLRDEKLEQRLSRAVEEVMVLAFADLTEGTTVTSTKDPWANEFKQSDAHSPELSVLLASQYFNWISTEALSALNLIDLASSCLVAIEKAFMSGTYLRFTRESLLRDNSDSITLSEGSNLEHDVDALLASESFTCVAYLCRLVARVITILSDALFRARKKRELWDLLNGITQRLHDMARRVEEDWRSSLLAHARAKNDLGGNISKLMEKVWKTLKTQLFSTLMLQQAVLDTILFHPPPPSPLATSNTYSPSHLTSKILNTLSSLSFIIASFGGVTAGSSPGAKGPTFPELKKVFYMSIDILSTDVLESESFVRGLVQDTDASCGSGTPFSNAKRSFTLTCIEQFIPVLNDRCIEEVVVPFCEPHLGDPSERQTYESAHSVMLSIFAAHADKSADISSSAEQQQGKGSRVDLKGKAPAEMEKVHVGLARRLVPGYAQCLLENAKEGRLTTPQLRLAYAALVRSASTGRHPHPPSPSPHNFTRASKDDYSQQQRSTWGVQPAWQWIRGSPEDSRAEFAGDPALAWLCIEQLLQALSLAAPNPDQHFALTLTLISLISSTHPALLPRLLHEIQQLIDTSYYDNQTDGERRRVLIENVFEEVMEKVGDAEREVVMQWWFECSRKWGVEGTSARVSGDRVKDDGGPKQRSML